MASHRLTEMLKMINDALEVMGSKGHATINTQDPKYADPAVWIEYENVMLYMTEMEQNGVFGKVTIPAWQIDVIVNHPGSRDVPPDADYIPKCTIPAGYGEGLKRFLMAVYELEIDNAVQSATMAALSEELERMRG